MKYLAHTAAAALLGLSGAALAQPATNIGSVSIAPAANGDISVDFDGDGTVTQATVILNFDNSNLQVDLTNCGGGNATIANGQVSCSNPAGDPNEIRIAVLNLSTNPLGDGTYGTINFTDLGGVPATYPITFLDESYSDQNAQSVAPSGSTEGSVDVTAPAGQGFYTSSDPAPGGTLIFAPVEINSAAPAETVTVENLSPDTAFDVTGVNVAAPLTNSDVFPITVAAGGSELVTFGCTPTTRGTVNGTFEIVHDSANGATSPVEYSYECTGETPNVAVATDPVEISGLIAPAAAPTGTLTVTNNDPGDGFTSTANNVSVAITTDPDGVFSVTTPGPFNIAVNASQDFTIECDNTTTTNSTGTATVTYDDPAGGTASIPVDLECTVTDTAPIYESDPVPGTTLTATAPFGTPAAPTGIDVNNANTNPAGDDLTINSATADDPVFNVTVVNGTFPPNGSFDAVNDVEVSCTPPGVGTITGTLTVDTNDPAQPGGGFTYPLECTGTGEESTLVPDIGETLNLGAVAPNSTTAIRSIDLTNNRIPGGGDFGFSCSIDSGDTAEITQLTMGTLTVAPGETGSIEYQCTPSAIEEFSVSVSCAISSGAVTRGTPTGITVTCSGRPLVVPTLNHWGLLLMSLIVLAAGGLAGRRLMA